MLHHRQPNDKCCALIWNADDIYLASMLFYYSMTSSQAKASAFTRFFGCIKWLEDVSRFRAGDSFAIIMEYDLDLIPGFI